MNRAAILILTLIFPLAMRDCGACYGQANSPVIPDGSTRGVIQ
jgi:hypothetical protein